MEDNTNNDSTVEQKEQKEQNDSTVEQNEQTTETTAYKELYTEQSKKLELLQKEVADLKVANAKLAIQQSAGETYHSIEEFLNTMF